jgi:hypothetical protein
MAYVIMWGNEDDPGFRYESLTRYAFDCLANGGPNNVAHQGVYNRLFIPETNEEGVIVLNQILNALIGKTDNQSKIAEYKIIKDSLNTGMEQRTAIDLIDYILQIISEDD